MVEPHARGSGSGGAERQEETPGERLDRQWSELLQELRVMQTGAQLTAGFLLTLPFTSAFGRLTDLQRDLYLALVLIAAVTTVLVLAPVAAHRRLSGERVKERLVAAAHLIVSAVLVLVSALVVGMVVLIFDVTVGRPQALTAGGVVAVLVVLLMLVVPDRLAAGTAGVDRSRRNKSFGQRSPRS
jgi:MFS family permease